MYDLIRDSTFGQILNILSAGKYLSYPEQVNGYAIPRSLRIAIDAGRVAEEERRTLDSATPKIVPSNGEKKVAGGQDLAIPRSTTTSSSNTTLCNLVAGEIDCPDSLVKKLIRPDEELVAIGRVVRGPKETEYLAEDRFGHSHDAAVLQEAQGTVDGKGARHPGEYVLIDWDGPDDPENPQNWSRAKKYHVTFTISLLTFSVYAGSSMYTASIPGLMNQFGSSLVVGELGLTLFIFGYGVGPMILSPLQEIPSIGRNPVYILSLLAYLLCTIGSAAANNMATVLVMRFLAGFFGSPALATGGATIGDIFPQQMLPYMIGLWAIGAVCGPSFAPLIGGYSAMFLGWRWPLWILAILTGFSLLFLFFLLPETLGATILHRRAARLRNLTGNNRISTLAERDQAAMSYAELAYDSLLRPIRIILEPQVLILSVYLGFVYSLFYLFFESFPLVFQDIYGFNEGELGLSFMGITVAAPFTYLGYALYNKYHLEPRNRREGGSEPEVRLEIGIFAGCIIPIAQLWFGWSSRASVHWIVPIIGAGLYLPGIFLMFQSILIYLPMSYPMYAASVLAGNDLVRSTMASVFPLFGRAYFVRLGLGGGSSLLAGLSIVMIPGIVWIRMYGKRLRAMSRLIPKDQNPAIEKSSTSAV